ncbi:MAG: sugar ABC transporter substrate-binding protein [Xanthomonadaceae bacterium]|nr:sugar ABC transporter substrate-binding protein [Xanthomonadaceae bacterium]
MNLIRLAALAALLLALSACATAPNGTSGVAASAGTAQTEGEYRIGVDDQIEVNVWRNPDLSVSVPVRPDGMISVPLIGDVQAGGRTPSEVAAAVRQKLTRYLRDPQVTVIVTELRSHEFISRVRVTGAVQNPISLPYRQGMTVLDAVLEAGGLTEFAAPNKAKLYRRSDKGSQVLPVRLARILSRGDLETNYYLKPGDIVSVPERLF